MTPDDLLGAAVLSILIGLVLLLKPRFGSNTLPPRRRNPYPRPPRKPSR